MDKAKKLPRIEITNPFWPGCHIVDGRQLNEETFPKLQPSEQKLIYIPLSIRNLDDVFGGSSEESSDAVTVSRDKYQDFPDISTDNNVLSVLNRSEDIVCITLSLVGSDYPIHYNNKKALATRRNSKSSSSKRGKKNEKVYLSSTKSYFHENVTERKMHPSSNSIAMSKKSHFKESTNSVVCFIVLLSPWTIIELGKIGKHSQFQIHSDIQKLIPNLLHGSYQSIYEGSCNQFYNVKETVQDHRDRSSSRLPITSKDAHSTSLSTCIEEGIEKSIENEVERSFEMLDFELFPLLQNSSVESRSSEHVAKIVDSDELTFLCSQAHGGLLTHFLHPSTYFAYDLDAPEGTFVRSSMDGIVVEAHDSSTSFGPDARNLFRANQITIEISSTKKLNEFSSGFKIVVEYVHIQAQSIPERFKVIGAVVKKGDIIAKSGRSGFTPTPHLHLQVVKQIQKSDSAKQMANDIKLEISKILAEAEDKTSRNVSDESDLNDNSSYKIPRHDQARYRRLLELLNEQTEDEQDNQIRHWLKNHLESSGAMNEDDTRLLLKIPDYLEIGQWSIPFKIKGCMLEQGNRYC